MFFRTKDSTPDADDRAQLTELARAYGGSRHAPIRGTFEGFADPRSSRDPGNQDLSEARATRIARELLHAFSATEAWYEHRATTGRGVDPAAPTVVGDDGLEDDHAPYRRVDVFLDGQAAPMIAMPQPVEAEKSDIPDYGQRGPWDWEDRFGYGIDRGDETYIRVLAIAILANLGQGADAQTQANLVTWGIPSHKPSWWEARVPTPILGRGGKPRETAREVLQVRARRLMDDYRYYVFYREDRLPDFSAFINGNRNPQLIERLGHLRFMIDEVMREGNALRRMVP